MVRRKPTAPQHITVYNLCFTSTAPMAHVSDLPLRYGKIILSGTTVKSGEAYCVVRLTGAALNSLALQSFVACRQH